ncbi:PAS domain-containing protein [bacterium]|nr:PAS domain-containing protein [bacterium]
MPHGHDKEARPELPRPAEQELAYLALVLPVPIWVFNPDLRVVYCNDETKRFGSGDDLGEHLSAFSQHVQEILKPLINDCLVQRAIISFEGWVSSDLRGRNFWHICCIPIGAENVACAIIDQTAQKSALTAVEKSEARYRELVESMAEGISAADTEGNLEFVNPALERILGHTKGGLAGMNITQLIDPSLFSVEDLNAELRTRSDAVVFELQFRRPDGDVRDLLLSVRPRFDPRNRYIGSFALTQDITLHKRAEKLLIQERNLTAAVIDSTPALVIVLDRHGRIVRFNRSCEELTGYSAERAVGTPIWELLITPEEVEAVKEVFANLTAGQAASTFENYWLTKSGDRRLISWSNSIIRAPNCEVEYIVGIGIDITARR